MNDQEIQEQVGTEQDAPEQAVTEQAAPDQTAQEQQAPEQVAESTAPDQVAAEPQASESEAAQEPEAVQEQAVQEQAAPEPQGQEQTQEQENKDFGQILAEFEGGEAGETGKGPKVGDKVKGRIVSITDDNIFVDLGGKAEGVLDAAQVKDAEGNLTVKVDDTIDATVASVDESGTLVLRRRAGGRQGGRKQQEVSAELRQAFENGLPVEGLVTGINKGGAEVQLAGMRAFCPLSQLALRYVEDPQQFVGQRLAFKISRLEEGRTRPNIVLSRRSILEEEAQTKAAETKERLKVSAILTGKITSLTTYGAFVDLGGVEGMLHVSEIGYARVSHPKDVFTVGQEIEVQVIKIEPGKDGRDRISLSRRSLERDPWQDVAERFPEGTELTGRVMRLETFGAFIEIAPGIEGLAHISELNAGRRIAHSREAVQLGQDVRVRVLGVDSERRRISLTLGLDAADRDRDRAIRTDPPRGGGGDRPDRGGERGGDRGRSRERRDDHDADYARSGSGSFSNAGSSGSGFGSLGDFFKDRKRNR
ncbi:MAG TPA: S1 RNA-binding domain-containing protein [Thermoanaerobaculia bacterium]|nr:S1 RNA-binding domain-containing protein [Thermoanaerobaculia bacterium]